MNDIPPLAAAIIAIFAVLAGFIIYCYFSERGR